MGYQLSPFLLGPIPLYEGYSAKNMENAWQFSKVYPEFADETGKPSSLYFTWAKKGWKDSFAHRYPNGKGAKPLYSYWKFKENNYWKEEFLSYIEARKRIYFVLYAKAVVESDAFKRLVHLLQSNQKIALWDFDGYDHEKRKMTYKEVIHSEKYKCGHAFVLYGLLTNQLVLKEEELLFNFN